MLWPMSWHRSSTPLPRCEESRAITSGAITMGSEVRRVGDLEISQDLQMQRRIWMLQRVGWGAIALVLLAMLLGLTGRGPLSSATAGQPGAALQVEYERFARFSAPAPLKIRLGPGVARDGKARIWFSHDYIESITIEQISPEPSSMKVLPDRHLYEFELPNPQGEATIMLHTKPQKIGSLTGKIGIMDGPVLSFQHIVYP